MLAIECMKVRPKKMCQALCMLSCGMIFRTSAAKVTKHTKHHWRLNIVNCWLSPAIIFLPFGWCRNFNSPPKKGANLPKTTESLLTEGQPGELSNSHLVHRAWLDVQVSMASAAEVWRWLSQISLVVIMIVIQLHVSCMVLHVTSMIQSDSMISSFTKCWKGLLQFWLLERPLGENWWVNKCEWRWITSSISANCGHNHASIWNPWELLVSLKFAASVLGTASLSRRSEGAPLSRCPDQAFFGNAWQSWQLWVSDFLSPTNDLKCWDTNKQILINY